MNDAHLAKWVEDGTTTLEGSLTNLRLEQVLMRLAEAPRSFELAITCADGRVARFDVGAGRMIRAMLGTERDPIRVLAAITGVRPEAFRLRLLAEPLLEVSSALPAAFPVGELLARAKSLVEDQPTIVEWQATSGMERDESELKLTEPMERKELASLVVLTPTEITPAFDLPRLDITKATELQLPRRLPPSLVPTVQSIELVLPDQTPQEPETVLLLPAPTQAGPFTFAQVGALGMIFMAFGFLGGAALVAVVVLLVLLLGG